MTKERRFGQRQLSSLAKDIMKGLQDGTLDLITAQTFRWLSRRETDTERYLRENPAIQKNLLEGIWKAKSKQSDIDRLRKIKRKV